MIDEASSLSLLTDDPAVEDRLGRAALIQTVVTLLQQIEPPACVAVYGSWGTGKTTVLQHAQRACQERGHTTVWFDPWEHERRSDVLSPLILQIAAARPNHATQMVKLLAATLVRSVAAVKLAIKIPVLGAEVSLERSLSAIWEDAKKTERYRDDVSSIKADFANFVSAILADDLDRRLIVFLDDLDRCLPSTTVEVIEAVKLLLCSRTGSTGLARVVFVFALDRFIVGEAVRTLLGGASSYTGENYLEKIFDFSVELPIVSSAHAKSFMDALSPGLGPFGNPLLVVANSVPAFGNPRVMKRAINRFRLLLATPKAQGLVAECNQDPARAHLLVVWMCGSERFRSFRTYFREVPVKEMLALHQAARGQQQDALSPEGRAIADSPGFLGYYSALTQNVASLDAFHSELRRVDDALREIGL
jgi:hypothetical protein